MGLVHALGILGGPGGAIRAGDGLRMRIEELFQAKQQLAHVLLVAPGLGGPDVIDDHMANFFGAVMLFEERFPEPRRNHLRHMLVLGDGENFRLAQATERNAILQSNHGFGPRLCYSR